MVNVLDYFYEGQIPGHLDNSDKFMSEFKKALHITNENVG